MWKGAIPNYFSILYNRWIETRLSQFYLVILFSAQSLEHDNPCVSLTVSWLSRGPGSSGEVWIGCKRLILKLSEVLSVKEVEGP